MSYQSEGFNVSSVYPWATWYVRNGQRLKSPINDRQQEVTISYGFGFGMGNKEISSEEIAEQNNKEAQNIKALVNVLSENNVAHKVNGSEITVLFDNPLSAEKVNMLNEKFRRLVRQSRNR